MLFNRYEIKAVSEVRPPMTVFRSFSGGQEFVDLETGEILTVYNRAWQDEGEDA